ncbi:MAG: YjfB family protein [Clostridiales bacterium]|nr:YjfB family protein [Clostridiales bacterium]
MEIEEIAAVSMGMKMAETEAAVNIAVTKQAMQMEQAIAAQLIQSLEAAVPVSFGHKLDVLA